MTYHFIRYCVTNKEWMEVSTTFDEDGIGQFSMVEYDGIMYVFSGFSPKLGCRTNLFAYLLNSFAVTITF